MLHQALCEARIARGAVLKIHARRSSAYRKMYVHIKSLTVAHDASDDDDDNNDDDAYVVYVSVWPRLRYVSTFVCRFIISTRSALRRETLSDLILTS